MKEQRRKIYYHTDRQLEGIRWLAKMVDFGVSLMASTAFNELYTAHMMLRERKDIYRGRIKMLANRAMDTARIRRGLMFSTMANRKFFDTYSDKVIDLAENDVTRFRISVKQILDDHRHPQAEVIAYAETARVMLQLAVELFLSACKIAREDYGTYKDYLGGDMGYEEKFSEFNCTDVSTAWERVCEPLYMTEGTINLNTDKTIQLFNLMSEKFSGGDYIDECMKAAAEEQPDFWNEILIRNGIYKAQSAEKKKE